MKEAKKGEYFLDGFMIRHFKVFPPGFDPGNLFDEQKIFLVYLVGNIPDMDAWQKNVEYRSRLEEIRGIKKESIELNKTDIDLANIHGKSLDDLRAERLAPEKKNRIAQLRKDFGIQEDPEETEAENTVEPETLRATNDPSKLWDMLEGKGLVKNGRL